MYGLEFERGHFSEGCFAPSFRAGILNHNELVGFSPFILWG
jgi:hypothetical protein